MKATPIVSIPCLAGHSFSRDRGGRCGETALQRGLNPLFGGAFILTRRRNRY